MKFVLILLRVSEIVIFFLRFCMYFFLEKRWHFWNEIWRTYADRKIPHLWRMAWIIFVECLKLALIPRNYSIAKLGQYHNHLLKTFPPRITNLANNKLSYANIYKCQTSSPFSWNFITRKNIVTRHYMYSMETYIRRSLK